MASETLGFFARIVLVLTLPLRVLLDGKLAAGISRLLRGEPAALIPDAKNALPQAPAGPSAAEERLKAALAEAEAKAAAADAATERAIADAEAARAKAQTALAQDPHRAALQVLAIFQRDGRLLDFLTEDVASFSDAEVGAAARLVHDGCKQVLRQYFALEPVRSEEEGARIVVERDFNPSELRLTGKVSGEPPFQGTLAHPGWRVTQVNLPAIAGEPDLRVLAPAEVEL
ncbi:MAG: DUF2760 domain-containing protein [Myxococcota bacterium]